MTKGPAVFILVLLMGAVFSSAGAVERAEVVVEEQFVASSFTRYAHAPTIVQTRKSERLVVAWFGGSSEGDDDVSIWINHREKDSSVWSQPVELDDGAGSACWNPVLFEPSSGPVLAYYRIGDEIAEWVGHVKTSEDEGLTWSARHPLPKSSAHIHHTNGGRFIGPVKNKPLELPDGTLLCGSSNNTGPRTHMELAGPDDYVNQFQLLATLSGPEAIQPTFIVHTDDFQVIQTICRHEHSGQIASPLTATSYDMGRTWEPLRDLNLHGVSPSGLDAITLTNLNSRRNRWFVLAYARGDDQQRLSVAISTDGENWDMVLPELEYNGEDTEMEYPSMIQSQDGLIHMVISWGRSQKIKHLVLDPWALTGEKPGDAVDLNNDGLVNFLDLAVVLSDMD